MPVLDPDLLRPSGALLATQLRLAAEIERLAVAPTGHDPKVLDLLVRLDLAEGRHERASRLCGQLNLSAAHMSRTIDRAEERGLVERRADPSDRRAHLVAITDAGDAVLEAFAPRLHGLLRRVVHEALDAEEVATLVALLDRITEACDALDDPSPTATQEVDHHA